MSKTAKNVSVTTEGQQEKKPKKALNTIVNIVVVLVIVFALFVSFSAFISKNGDGVPNVFGVSWFAIESDSMKPTFSKGDVIVDTKVTDPSTLKVNDVITFWTVINGERALNSHRIIQVEDYGNYYSFVTKGDNNTIEDGLTVHQSSVVGKYAFHIPGIGYVISFAETSIGFLVCIVLPCAILFIVEIVNFFKSLFAYKAEKTRLDYQAEVDAKMAAMGLSPEQIAQIQAMQAANAAKKAEEAAAAAAPAVAPAAASPSAGDQ